MHKNDDFIAQAREKELKTGTTTVGIIAKDAVVLAADQRASMGYMAADEKVTKVFKVTDQIGFTMAGVVGDAQTILRFLRSQANLFELERETKITPRALTTLLANVLNGNRHFPFILQAIIAGIDNNNKPQIFDVTPYGGSLQKDNYTVTGSGTPYALTTLDQNYKENMTEQEAIDLVIQAVSASKNRDMASGGIGVTVAVIDKNGYREVDPKQVEKIVSKIKLQK